MKLQTSFLLLIFVLIPFSGFADEVRPAYLAMQEQSPDTFTVLWKYPIGKSNDSTIQVKSPDGCELLGERNQWQDAVYSIHSWSMHCNNGLVEKQIKVTGLDTTATELLLRIQFIDNSTLVERLTPVRNSITVPPQPTAINIIKSYFMLGVEHILAGTDHLLFVVCVMLLLRSKKKLLLAITAFTVAHSITLVAATLGIIQLNPTAVEILIALSIVLLAYEVMRDYRGVQGLSTRYPWLVIFVFGLMHGLGFAGALGELGLPQNDIPLALLFFNIGVEAGQLLFIFCVLLILWPFRIMLGSKAESWKPLPAYAIGIAASFWFFQRLSSLWS